MSWSSGKEEIRWRERGDGKAKEIERTLARWSVIRWSVTIALLGAVLI